MYPISIHVKNQIPIILELDVNYNPVQNMKLIIFAAHILVSLHVVLS